MLRAASKFRNLVTRRSGFITLIYHSVSDNATAPIDISCTLLDQHLSFLADEGYQIRSLVDVVRDPRARCANSVVLTFDDGFDDFYQNAIPILQSHNNAPATVYVVTDCVLHPDRPFKFASGKLKKSMTAEQVEEISKLSFINIGSHTHTHSDLVRSFSSAQFELEESLVILKQLTGLQEVDFCYPWAAHNSKLKNLVSKTFRSATIGKGGDNSCFDPYQIRRIPIKNEGLDGFASRLKLDTVFEDQLRDTLAKYRSS